MGLNLIDIVVWWLVLEITGLAALPIASQVSRNLKDKGYSAAKPLGLLLLTYISWIISVFAGYSYYSVLLSLVVIGVCSLVICLVKGIPLVDKKYIIKFELLFAGAFVVFAIIRAYSPDIYWTGGEKFMDMSFINGILRTSQFPPQDPWMSGTAMYYYYFGYLVVADLIKLTAVLPSIAFNLATASFFALAFTTALGIGYNLTEKMKYGIITAFLVTIAGNLVGFFQMMDILLGKDNVIYNILSFNYWPSSRVIPNTINEFPFFSFLQGDVHPHMISITFQILILLLMLNIFKSDAPEIIPVLVLGLAIGFLYPLNTWDYPVYLILSVLIIGSSFFLTRKTANPDTPKKYLKAITAMVAMAAFSYLPYLPYHESYNLTKTLLFVPPDGRTQLVYYLAIYGLFLYLISRIVMPKSKKSFPGLPYLILALILFFILSIVLKFELLILLAPLLILSTAAFLKEQDKIRVFVIILILTGTLLSLFCELFYIKDEMGNANPALLRMNTVFKIYLDNWILWAVPAGYAVFQYRNSFSQKKMWGIFAIILILMVSVYPVFATIGKSGMFRKDKEVPDMRYLNSFATIGEFVFRGDISLGGELYVKREHPQEYAAILWFRNLSGQPVVLQAGGDPYQWNAYITAFTGLPTVIGWGGHEINWRSSYTQVNTRISDVNTIYTSLNADEVNALLRKYNVTYIYFGEVEAKIYRSPRLFDSHPEIFSKAFEYGDVVVYKVEPDR
jgi:YYY domain-containing protein